MKAAILKKVSTRRRVRGVYAQPVRRAVPAGYTTPLTALIFFLFSFYSDLLLFSLFSFYSDSVKCCCVSLGGGTCLPDKNINKKNDISLKETQSLVISKPAGVHHLTGIFRVRKLTCMIVACQICRWSCAAGRASTKNAMIKLRQLLFLCLSKTQHFRRCSIGCMSGVVNTVLVICQTGRHLLMKLMKMSQENRNKVNDPPSYIHKWSNCFYVKFSCQTHKSIIFEQLECAAVILIYRVINHLVKSKSHWSGGTLPAWCVLRC